MSELPDIQNQKDERGIAIDRVGVTGIIFPTKVRVKRTKMDQSLLTLQQETAAKVDLYVGLPHDYRGANLSRFMQCLLYFHLQGAGCLSIDTLPELLKKLQEEMKSEDAYARIEFNYFANKLSPVTELSAPQAYKCAFTGIMKKDVYRFILEVNVIAASLCPCSKEMSLLENLTEIVKEKDTATIIGEGGPPMLAGKSLLSQVGMGAHNQRSLIRVQLTSKDNQIIWIEDVIDAIEKSASAPTYPVLKRPDEKFVTEQAYNNAKFSEDILRDLQKNIEALPNVDSWSLKVENEESIHPYNVTCYQNSDNWNH
jgi:GTP cyclohydrolase I